MKHLQNKLERSTQEEMCIYHPYFEKESFRDKECYREIKDLNPNCKCLMCDGYDLNCEGYEVGK